MDRRGRAHKPSILALDPDVRRRSAHQISAKDLLGFGGFNRLGLAGAVMIGDRDASHSRGAGTLASWTPHMSPPSQLAR